MTQNAFEWHPATQLLEPGEQISCLRGLVCAQRSIAISPAGATPLAAPETGQDRYLHCTTSGTTGNAKVIRRRQSSWVQSFAVNGRVLGLSPSDCVALFGTLAHSLALYGTLEAAHHGADILDLHGMRPDRQCDALAQNGATVLYITPTQLGLVCAQNTAPNASVRHILVGGGQLSNRVRRAAAKTFPNARLIHFYGAAETSFIAWSNAFTPRESVGTAYPDVTISIRDETGQETDQIGEIWVKSPYLFDGYANGASADTRWNGDYLSIAELGRLDAHGNLFVIGRKNRMVTISDTNIFPEEIEGFLAATLGTDSVAVIPLPDAKRGHRLVAVIAGADGTMSEHDLLVLCRQTLGPLRAPRQVHFVAALPMLAAGKPDYCTLTQWVEATA
ncbi:MAG: AMP-binding protein [Roseovarius sp.]|nr:AMP-binding protein [Roseovarius sp.]